MFAFYHVSMRPGLAPCFSAALPFRLFLGLTLHQQCMCFSGLVRTRTQARHAADDDTAHYGARRGRDPVHRAEALGEAGRKRHSQQVMLPSQMSGAGQPAGQVEQLAPSDSEPGRH